jgi:hypothetical protein
MLHRSVKSSFEVSHLFLAAHETVAPVVGCSPQMQASACSVDPLVLAHFWVVTHLTPSAADVVPL